MKRHTRISMIGIGIFTALFLMSMGTSFAQKETGNKGATESKKFDTYEPGKGEKVKAGRQVWMLLWIERRPMGR